MFNCVTGSRYNMTADVYTSSGVRDSATGTMKKTYSYSETINCFARSVIRTGLSDNSTVKEKKSNIISTRETVKIRHSTPIDTESLITNIKNSAGLVVWSESDEANSGGGINGATIFQVEGNTPILNQDGLVIEYEVVICRVDIQKVALSA
jgi:hypothetical protein